MDSHPEARVNLGREVEYFACHLDDLLAPRGNVAQRRARILKLVGSYHTYSIERVAKLKKQIQLASARSCDEDWPTGSLPGNHGTDTHDTFSLEDIANVSEWELESQTWDLLRRVLPLRYPEPERNKSSRKPPQSRKEYWAEFLQSDPVVIERKAVLEWLQTTADSGPDMDEMVKDLQASSERGDLVAYGWIHTRSAIKKTKIVHAWPNVLDLESRAVSEVHVDVLGLPLVTQLDPDSTTRQRRKLQQQDEYFEKSIWLGCFELLRRGKSTTEISEWCSERTEAWRAVSMSAFPLGGHDHDDRGHDHDDTPFDPSVLVLWRRMSYALVRQAGTNDYERAVYGILSGDIPSVEKVCRCWDDFVFAYYNALLRTQFDNYLIQKCPPEIAASICQIFPAFDAVQFHGNSHPPHPTEGGPLKGLQAAIVTGTVDNFMFRQGLVLARQASRVRDSKIIRDFGAAESSPDESSSVVGLGDHNALRVISHVQVIITALEKLVTGEPPMADARRQVQQNVVAAYAMLMRMACLDHLIPLYCSKLEGARVYEVLSHNVIHITDSRKRQVQLDLMKGLGLDAARFVELQTTFFGDCDSDCTQELKILSAGPPSLKYGRRLLLDFVGDDPEVVERPDEWLIRSLEWLLIVDGVWEGTFLFGIKLYKYFLGHLKLPAARALAERVPCSAIFGHKAGVVIPDDGDPAWFERVEAGCQVLCRVEDDGVAISAQMLMAARPYWELECLARTIDVLETVSSLVQLSTEDPAAVQKEFWSKVGNDVKLASALVKPLMNRWLSSDEADRSTAERLREAYLPETIMGYISILHFAGTALSRDNLLECMDLAAAIADKETSDLAALFVRCGRMQELLESFASCSKAIAVCTGEKKSHPGRSKKLNEMGWSRELWSVRQG